MALTTVDFDKMMKKKGFSGNGFGCSGDFLGSLLLDQYSSSPLPLMMMKQKKKAEDDNHKGADGCIRFSVCRHIGRALLEELFGLSMICDEEEEGGKKMKLPSSGGRGRGVSIKEDEEAKTVKVEMPGLGKENIKVRVVNNTLLIEGDDDGQKETDDENGIMKKHHRWGLYLPDDVYKSEELKAVMKNGVLTVVIPKLKVEEMKGVIHVVVDD